MKPAVASGGAELAVSDETFGKEFNEALVHQVVTAYRNAAALGHEGAADEGRRRGGGRKPRPQKGGGTSRAGSIRSPIWVGGGRAFAAKPRDFAQKVNKKMAMAPVDALRAVRRDRLVVAQDFTVDTPKTKQVAEKLKPNLDHVLIIVEGIDEKLFLGARNLKHVEVLPVAQLNPLSLASYDKVLMTVGGRETHRGAPAMSAAKKEAAPEKAEVP